MRDDSFVVEAFVANAEKKNVAKNYENHKWIKKSFHFFFSTFRQNCFKEIFKVELHEMKERQKVPAYVFFSSRLFFSKRGESNNDVK
jgi:hypothetical protein